MLAALDHAGVEQHVDGAVALFCEWVPRLRQSRGLDVRTYPAEADPFLFQAQLEGSKEAMVSCQSAG